MKAAVIIAAGGIGKRMGQGKPKQYLELLGRPMICHTLDRFSDIADIKKVIAVLPDDFVSSFKSEILTRNRYPENWTATAGGEKRQDSVRNGLKLVPDDFDVVLVHDACRPFITKRLIEESIEVAYEEGAAIIAAPIKETLKRISNGNNINGTVDRQNLWGAQTPQAFRQGILKKAYEKAYRDGFYGTDDAILVERIGEKVKVIEGDYRNIKITTPEDLIIAEAIAKSWSVTEEITNYKP